MMSRSWRWSSPARTRSATRCCSIRPKGVSRSYEVDNLPMTVLIDRGGVIRHVLRDYSPANDTLYLQELRALLNE